MDQLKTTYLGKMPLFLDDVRFLEQKSIPFITAIASAIAKGNNRIIKGCSISGTGTFTVQPGFVIIDGELLFFAGGDIAAGDINHLIFLLSVTNDPAGSRQFGDGAVRDDIYILRRAILGVNTGVLNPGELKVNQQSIEQAVYEPAFTKNSAFNKNFGTGTNDVIKITAAGLNQIQEQLGVLLYEAVQNGGAVMASINSAFNRNFGTNSGEIIKIDADYGFNQDQLQVGVMIYSDVAGGGASIVEIGSAFNKAFANIAEAKAGLSAGSVISPLTLAAVTGGVITKYFEIGTWNMGASDTKNVDISLGGTFEKIIGIRAIVRTDDNLSKYNFETVAETGVGVVSAGGAIYIPESNLIITLKKNNSSYFHTSGFFVSPASNRGWVIVDYLP